MAGMTGKLKLVLAGAGRGEEGGGVRSLSDDRSNCPRQAPLSWLVPRPQASTRLRCRATSTD